MTCLVKLIFTRIFMMTIMLIFTRIFMTVVVMKISILQRAEIDNPGYDRYQEYKE